MGKDWNVTVGNGAGKSFVNVYLNGKRYRYWNGKVIGVALNASENTELLRSAFELKLMEGWRPQPRKPKKVKPVVKELTLLEIISARLERIQQQDYSFHYKRDCKWVANLWTVYSEEHRLEKLLPSQITKTKLTDFITQQRWSPRTQKNVLTNFKILTKGELDTKLESIKLRRVKSELHKPIRNPNELLEDIKLYDQRLYLACILTYGCLLRPHQEVRLLKWGDIDFNRRIISLSGKRNKSGRNRVVPLSSFVIEALSKFSERKERSEYILSSSDKPYNRDFLSLLWSRYKKTSKVLGDGVTLYSWRHHGAVKVFEKTGSLLKLQQVMGHSDMKVSLTYLRGLEVKQLDVEDLPEL